MILLVIAASYIALQLKLKGFERDMRVYLLERGVADEEIVSIEAHWSHLPTYPVIVKLSQEPQRGYLFKPDEQRKGHFVLIDSRPPQMLYTDDPLEPKRSLMRDTAYLEAYGFADIQPVQDPDSYVLTADTAPSAPYRDYWAAQNVDPALLYNQTIHTYQYAADHPDIRRKLGLKPDDKLWAYVIVAGDLARGGYLTVETASGERNVGGVYSLKGETADE
ncbi:hypothetical protein CDO73_01155 [Saccharibacillus sp. O23]|uniref:hypothetical protein n=1 Tax=Saccharibacillus sp. O23 TaxID=2009338 RepID=UPI000B4E2479|nr:hypothetical protein [Saccharibacillus sp. O23]OWR33141.1 hypothetical protein CDO73_01155 [Saccharibacillus sp. O23]